MGPAIFILGPTALPLAQTIKAKTGGKIAKRARLELEAQTGKKVVTSENYLPMRPIKKLPRANEE